MSKILPKKKQQVLKYLAEFMKEHGYAPPLTTIAAHFGLSSTATVHEHIEYLEQHGFLTRVNGEMEIVKKTNTQLKEETYMPGSAFQLPVVGLITAGSPIEAIEDRSEILSVPRELARNPNSYILKVKGDSMIESFIDDGDFVVVQKQDYARDGDIVVALLDDGSATLKEYHKEKRYVRLQPRNANYDPIRVKSVVIQGKVVGIIRRFQ
ncbi:MAG: transcriptional repressor LexA [Candidatus Kerfeldbacteria bacterium]|nr:transcriptional repressor LexA [Candidatus Kerfeldbacteria bacterium]